jgi:hypothetical protein
MTQQTTTVSEQSTESTESTVIAGVTATPKPKRTAKPKTPAKPKPAPKPEPKPELSKSDARTLILNMLIEAGSEIAKNWDEKSTGISKQTAIDVLSNRLSYCGSRCDYPAPLTVS